MILTPFSKSIRGIDRFINDSLSTGAIPENHGEAVTIRPLLDVVDENSASNLEVFYNLEYA